MTGVEVTLIAIVLAFAGGMLAWGFSPWVALSFPVGAVASVILVSRGDLRRGLARFANSSPTA